jgi:hypothetical protein
MSNTFHAYILRDGQAFLMCESFEALDYIKSLLEQAPHEETYTVAVYRNGVLDAELEIE